MMRRILIIILVLLLVGTGVWYFYIRPKEQGTSSPVPNVLRVFFPTSVSNNNGSFGNNNTVGNATISTPTATTPAPAPIFQQLTARPVAGYTIFSLLNKITIPSGNPKVPATIKTTTDYYLRYVSRINGYVYEIKNDAVPLQISNIFIPNIYEAAFMDSNNTAILRFLRGDDETIATYSVPVPPLNPDGTRTQKSGTYLPDNIYEIAVSPDQTKVARATIDNNGTVITTSTSLGTGIKTLLRNPFEEWLPSWAGSTLYLQTKATSVASGFLYSVDPTARLRRIVGDVAGLTTSASPSGTYVLYSETTDAGFITKLFNTKTNATVPISLAIMPENCAWLKNEDLICAGNTAVPSGLYPDAWYAGTVHLSDQIYRITTASNVYAVLYDGSKQAFDMTDLQVDEDQQRVYFIDKTTGFLWRFSISQ